MISFDFVRARFSGSGLVVFSVWLVPACLVSPPPEFEDPRPTRPNVNQPLVVPKQSEVLILSEGDRPSFTVPFSSEDAGDDIRWFLWLNYGLDGMRLLEKNRLPPGGGLLPVHGAPQGPPDRELTFSWLVGSDIPSNCQQLTLIVTHDSNVDWNEDLPIDKSLVAELTWWMNIDAPLDGQQTLSNCPTSSSVQSD